MTTALTAPMAMADVTAEDVWNNLVTAGDLYGEQFSGSIAKNGNITQVSDLNASVVLPDGTFKISLGGMSMTERGDGTVLLQFDASSDVEIEGDMTSIGESFKLSGKMNVSGLDAVASGEPGNLTYTYAVPNANVTLTDFKLEFDGLSEEDVNADVTVSIDMTEFNSVYQIDTTAGLTSSGNANYGGVSIDVDAEIVEGGEAGTMSFNIDIADLLGTFDFTLPNKAAAPDLPSLIEAGLDMVYTLTMGASNTSMSVDAPDEQFAFNSTSTGGKLDSVVNTKTLSYGFESTGTNMALSGSDIPFPEVTAGIGRMALGLTMPSGVLAEDGDVGLEIALEDVTIADFLWGLFDPTGKLPRDPATVAVELSGKGKLLVDIYDPQALETMAFGGMPAELANIDIDRLEVRAAGAEATGSGGFTFDNTDLATFPGMPRPEGSASIRMTGVNGLMDNLVALGLLPKDQVLGARMMMGIFARPGEGPDTLETELEVTADGAVMANGQSLR
ncbi:hypothetical protein ACMU_02825 [Actibacterium mucosum KCTC 23349]|uniref:DUF2125 domain-containing protein n=1 Tax=Actibacterium mucosum KCTC 23349 TaxID=1454373 RepID=A0A037ZP79_9RHOB|nr:DUF2125 domain-containing protein [Actibacterium mucosum]KAJ57455.1 hypothetical protein ACMU_02825 [Actibacterium mucosum KCTC 23349]